MGLRDDRSEKVRLIDINEEEKPQLGLPSMPRLCYLVRDCLARDPVPPSPRPTFHSPSRSHKAEPEPRPFSLVPLTFLLELLFHHQASGYPIPTSLNFQSKSKVKPTFRIIHHGYLILSLSLLSTAAPTIFSVLNAESANSHPALGPGCTCSCGGSCSCPSGSCTCKWYVLLLARRPSLPRRFLTDVCL